MKDEPNNGASAGLGEWNAGEDEELWGHRPDIHARVLAGGERVRSRMLILVDGALSMAAVIAIAPMRVFELHDGDNPPRESLLPIPQDRRRKQKSPSKQR